MTIALRLATVLTIAALSGCGSDPSPAVVVKESAASTDLPDPSSAETPSPETPDSTGQPGPDTVPWNDRVDYQEWQPPLPPGQDGWPTEPPSRWPELQARLVLPQAVRPGETVDYVVVLRNQSDHTVDLLPCAGYQQEVQIVGAGMAAEPVSGGESTFRLNCDGAPILLPAQSRRYAMRLVVPADATGDEILFTWGFLDNMPDYEAQDWIQLSTN